MPAIGSLEKAPSEYETAPTRRPSMYTGLPLIPAITPVWARGPPSSLARIRLRLGPMTFLRTPRMCTLKSSSRSPSNTVRPTPTIPGLSSSTGNIVVAAGVETTLAAAMKPIAATEAIVRIVMREYLLAEYG
jgi:hypothetical protein